MALHPRISIRMAAPARREQLLDVATELAIQRGFHAVSIELVARHAGVTRALIYQHFRDLRALLEAVIEREMARALAQVSETTPSDLTSADPRQELLDSLRAYLCAVKDHPNTWRLVLMAPEGAPRSLRKRIAQGRATVLAKLTQAVRPAMSPDAEGVDADLTARILSAISDEYARLVLSDPTRFEPERLLRHASWWLHHPGFGHDRS